MAELRVRYGHTDATGEFRARTGEFYAEIEIPGVPRTIVASGYGSNPAEALVNAATLWAEDIDRGESE